MRLYAGGYLDRYLPQRRKTVEIDLEKPTSIKKILSELGIPAGEVALVVINGELVDLQGAVVSGKDDLKLYPPADGG
jgi:sulfur carrier protein ThiS